MKTIEIDIECRSDVDLTKAGVYRYVDSPYFAITLMSISVDGGEVQLYDLENGNRVPDTILYALVDESVVKKAFNVNFERVCLSKYLREFYPHIFRSYSISEDSVVGYLSPVGWQCTMIHCRTLGLPSTLAAAGAALKLEQQKMPEGKALIKYFCVPYDTVNGIPQFHTPADAPEKWETFKAYNKQDVKAELAIDQRLSRFPVPEFIWKEFYLDQEINDRGIRVDMELVEAAITLDAQAKAKLSADMRRLTGIENPNSVYQLLDWLEGQGCKPDSLDKKQVRELLKTAKDPVKSVLELRLMLSKSSVKKYQAMQTAACSDHRARGMFSFYGASRTGRWAGRIIQLQNLRQNHIPDLTEARNTVKYGYYDEVEMFYDDVPDTLSQLIRTAFVPRPGCKFIVADFSAIEARVIAWLAGEQWRMDAFANGADIYCASASKMFGVPVVKHGVNGHLRQKGKVAELVCGYGGSVGAMKAMGGDDLNLSDTELKQIVTDWRNASPNIVRLWWAVDDAVKLAVKAKGTAETHGLQFSYQSKMLFITLPCVYADHLTDAQKKAYILADNRMALDAGWDEELLAVEMEELQNLGFDLGLTGFDEKELADLFASDENAKQDDFDVDAELEKPCFSKLGDIWHLGRHTVICGDSTLPETYAALLGDSKVNLVCTDPPYLVNLESTSGKIKNDDLDDEKGYEFLKSAFERFHENMAKDASIYVFYATSKARVFHDAYEDAGFKVGAGLVWKKDRLVLTRTDWKYIHEPIIWGWRKDGKHIWYGDQKQKTVFEFDRIKNSKEDGCGHPSSKPVPLIAYLIQQCTQSNGLVLDGFLGSASTLIACEQLDRICYGVELEPKFVDVAVERYIKLHDGKFDDVYLIRDGQRIEYADVPKEEQNGE